MDFLQEFLAPRQQTAPKIAPVEPLDTTKEYLAVDVAGSACVLELKSITEILANPVVMPLPKVPVVFLGVFSWRGLVVPLLDPAHLLLAKSDRKRSLDEPGRALILSLPGDPLALWVDSVQNVLRIPLEAIETLPQNERSRLCTQVVQEEDARLRMVLNVESVLHILEGIIKS